MNRAILLALLAASGIAQASNWVSVLHSDDGKREVFIDVSDIRDEGVIRRAWVKVVFQPHTKNGEGTGPRKWWHDSVSLMAFNCAEKTHRIEAITVYYEDGTHITEDAPTPWEPIFPDSLASAPMQIVCALKPK
jgi:hypothetical protein